MGQQGTTALQQAKVRSNRLSEAGHVKIRFLERSPPDTFALSGLARCAGAGEWIED
jgi:hypothetical protein